MSVSSINLAMQSRGMYCASPQSVRQMQAPRGQISSMQADPSAYAAADSSLSPSGEAPSWWDSTVQWVQTHVPETIFGALVAAGGIALSVWALKGRGGGKKGVGASSPSYTPSPSGSPSNQQRTTKSDGWFASQKYKKSFNQSLKDLSLDELRSRAATYETGIEDLHKEVVGARKFRNLGLGDKILIRSEIMTTFRKLWHIVSPPTGQRLTNVREWKENNEQLKIAKWEYSAIRGEIDRRIRIGKS